LVSKARCPAISAILLANPKKVILWYSKNEKESIKPAKDIKHILDHFHINCELKELPDDSIKKAQEKIRAEIDKNSRILFSITNGNLLMRLAAFTLSEYFPEMYMIYRELYAKRFEFTGMFYDAAYPTTVVLREQETKRRIDQLGKKIKKINWRVLFKDNKNLDAEQLLNLMIKPIEKPHWYSIKIDNNTLFVNFIQNKDDNHWTPDILTTQPLPTDIFKDKEVIIKGKSAVWIYAHAAITAFKGKAKSIYIAQANVDNPIKIFPIEDCEDQDNNFFQQDPINNNIHIIRFIPKLPFDPWNPIGQIHIPRFFNDNSFEHCCLTGQGANWMYASFAIQACKAGVKTISCYIPRESTDSPIILNNNLTPYMNCKIDCPKIIEKVEVNGSVIGIVGDPNSGKSVFSAALAAVAYDMNINSWILDCDGASPTPKWFTSLLRDGEADEAIKLRNSQKIEWTHELEKNIAIQIKNLKNTTKITFADMPGGDHRDKKNPLRIPPGREVMMKEVDKFIVLGRKGEDIADKWIDELKKHNLDNRVIAVFDSHSPKSEPELIITKVDSIFKGNVTGLDREQELKKFIDKFKFPLTELFEDVLSDN